MARTKPIEQDEPLDFARGIFNQVIAKHDPEASREAGKDPQKVASGIKGGSKGGHARARTLSAKKRTQIAKKAAKARWKK
jgi:hypothetical protein